MSERVIKLSLEKAKEFYKKGGEFRDLALSAYTEEELTKVELPKTWEDFCYNYKIQNEYYIGADSIIRQVSLDNFRLPCRDSNLLPNRQAAEAHLALIKLHQLRDCYRQDWKPDWKDTSMPKYCIYFINKEQKFDVCSFYERREFLSFQSRKLAEEFLNNFRELILQAGDLI